jgi:anthranilate phosphoribosyltransferase
MDLVPAIAGVLKRLGCDRAMVVASQDGLDEISVCAPTTVAHLYRDGTIVIKSIEPGDLGIVVHRLEALAGGNPEENAEISMELFRGAQGPVRDAVAVNAAAALVVAGRASDLEEGLNMANASLDSGDALEVLEKLRKLSTAEAQ